MELLIQIVDNALGPIPEDSFCKVGHNGIWFEQTPGGLDLMLKQPSRPHTPIGDDLPFLEGIEKDDASSDSSDEYDEALAEFYAVARSLRLCVSSSFRSQALILKTI
jgi:hypothetical protein